MNTYLNKCNYLIKCLIKKTNSNFTYGHICIDSIKRLIKKRSQIQSWTLLDTCGHFLNKCNY
jgi:hypothetical protein